MLGIIGAMDQEVTEILAILNLQKQHTFYGIDFWEGTINGVLCVIGKSGVGKVNASICTMVMIDKFYPSNIINFGAAGALNPDVNIGDVVISTSCVQHDFDISAFGHEVGYVPGIKKKFIESDKSLIKICEKILVDILQEEHKILLGPVTSGDQFLNSPQKKDYLWNEFGAFCGDMEAAAIAQVCCVCNIPFVSIRSVSDNPGADNNELTFYEFLSLASRRCSAFIDEFTKFVYNEHT